ncbi:hypothetical protein EH223_01100 [candidate division KSB1 bacterium]|nr:hypothetical protein [candidate division KSB1 bacterium]RQW06993.1 MAG: hypothetical protein EH223_01100 [candidate division KSB1 bacterium]
MNKFTMPLCALLVFSINLSGQSLDVINLGWQNWSIGTAQVLPQQRVEIGVFQPLRYGYSEKMEFSVHPLLFFVAPNFDIKRKHAEIGGISLASLHGLSYPTWLMRLLAREGIGGLISPEFNIPHIISVQNELFVSGELLSSHLLTGILAFNFAVKSGPLDPRTTIDLPVVYIRSGVYYHDYGMRAGVDIKGALAWRWSYVLDGMFFYYPKAESDINMAFEHKGLLYWTKSRSFQICLGYLLSYGEYPFGTQWHLLPLVDMQWGWTRKGR